MEATHSDFDSLNLGDFFREFSRAQMEAVTQAASLAGLLDDIMESNCGTMRTLSRSASAIESISDLASTVSDLFSEDFRAIVTNASALSSVAAIFNDLRGDHMRAKRPLGSRQSIAARMPKVMLPSREVSEVAPIKRDLNEARRTIRAQEAELEAMQLEIDSANVERNNAIAELEKERREKASIAKFASGVLELSEAFERENKALKRKMSDGAWTCNSFA